MFVFIRKEEMTKSGLEVQLSSSYTLRGTTTMEMKSSHLPFIKTNVFTQNNTYG